MNTVNILCEFRQQISRRGYTVTQPAERRKCITVVVAVAVHTKMKFSFGCSAQIVVHLLFAFLFSFFFSFAESMLPLDGALHACSATGRCVCATVERRYMCVSE